MPEPKRIKKAAHLLGLAAALGGAAVETTAYASDPQATEVQESPYQDLESRLVQEFSEYDVVGISIGASDFRQGNKGLNVAYTVHVTFADGSAETLLADSAASGTRDTEELARAAIDRYLGINRTNSENNATQTVEASDDTQGSDALADANAMLDRAVEDLLSREAGFKKRAENLLVDKDLKLESKEGILVVSSKDGIYKVHFTLDENGTAVSMDVMVTEGNSTKSEKIDIDDNTHLVAIGDTDNDGDVELVVYDVPVAVIDDSENKTGVYEVKVTTVTFNTNFTLNWSTVHQRPYSFGL